MARPIEANSIRQLDKGFVKMSVGTETHRKLKAIATSRGLSISALVRSYVEDTGEPTQGAIISRRPAGALTRIDTKLDAVSRSVRNSDLFFKALAMEFERPSPKKGALVMEYERSRRMIFDSINEESIIVESARTLAKAVKKVADEARSIASVENSQGELGLA